MDNIKMNLGLSGFGNYMRLGFSLVVANCNCSKGWRVRTNGTSE